jgi:uncharacterized protein (TIGR02611 family)
MGGRQSPTEPSAESSSGGDEASTSGVDAPSSAVDGAGTGGVAPVSRPSYLLPASWRDRLRSTLEVVRANPTGRFALRVSVAAAGLVVVAVGLALIPLPGPGWLLVILGLSIWAIEFAWAKNLLHFTRRNVQAWTRWVGRQSWPIRIGIGLIGLIFVSVVVWLSLKFSFGIDLAASIWKYVTTH